MPKKNKVVDFLTKENKYEQHILCVMAVIGIIIGILGVLGIIDINGNKMLFTVLLIISPFTFIISLYTIIKTKKENKKPKAKIYQMLENKEFDKVKYIFLDYDYVLQNIGDEYIIYLENSFDFVTTKEDFQLLITLYKDKISLDIDVDDNKLETIDEAYFNNQIESLTVLPLTENSNVEDVIKMMDNMISVFGDQLLELYEKYKK